MGKNQADIKKTNKSTKIFVNLPVKDLNKSIKFFTKLGFKFNPQFTDKKAACMIISETIFSMLIVEKFFKTFTRKNLADSSKTTEVILALSAESRKKVDEMIKKVAAAGGAEYRKPEDHGWMYGRSFQDLDNHIWEIFYVDEKSIPKKMKNK